MIGNPRPPSSEDEHMRRKMQDAGGPVVIEPKNSGLLFLAEPQSAPR